MASRARKGIGGFQKFLLRGNVIDLAVGIVIGSAFTAVVQSLVKGLITPMIGLFGGQPDFANYVVTVNNARFAIGDFINALISFVISAAVVYFFVVRPFSALLERYMPKKETGPTRSCPECLSDIPVAARRCSFCTSEVEPAAA